MVQCHWNNFNTFEHYGSGDLDMLGWDSLRHEETLRLFHFNDAEAADLRARLLKTMPDELLALASEEPITVDAVRHTLANTTAARFSDLDSVIVELHREKQIEVIGVNNKARSLRLRNLNPYDRIAIPKQLRLFLTKPGRSGRSHG